MNNIKNVDISKELTERYSRFEKLYEGLVPTSDDSYNKETRFKTVSRFRNYSQKEVENIIQTGSLKEQRKLSEYFFNKDGFYKRILLHYATLLNYSGILIPEPARGRELKQDYIIKRYNQAIHFIDKMSLPAFFTNCAINAFIYGCYYGVIEKLDKNTFSVLDLPIQYCCSRFKDSQGNDIIEFDVSYFNTIFDSHDREIALSAYPLEIQTYYQEFLKGKKKSRWAFIPTDKGICFPLLDETPIFLSTIPATMDYDESVDTERERDLEEIKKIIVQKIPHLQDGNLLFEPEEAKVMHNGSVQMLSGNKNISVLTTYADVDAIISKTAADTASNNLEKMMNNIYYQAGTSSQLFAASGNLALSTSLNNDLSLVMILAYKFQTFVTNIINQLYGNSNISFKYTILPITHYNAKDYIDNAFKLAGSGYSFLLPMIAMGFSQSDLGNLKDLENNILKLNNKLIPLQSSYTQSSSTSNSVGAPEKEEEEKTDKTLQNQVSLDEGGSN